MTSRILLIGLLILLILANSLTGKKIDIYGYSNFMLNYQLSNNNQNRISFAQHRTNLLFSSAFYKRWDFFINLEFKGSIEWNSVSEDRFIGQDFTPEFKPETNQTEGEIELEEVWTRFTVSEILKIKTGIFHAPFGTFNVLQDIPPSFISVRPPLIYDSDIRNANPVSIIPDKANIEFSGLFQTSGFILHYHLYAGSGNHPEPHYLNIESNVSFGSRLLFNFNENAKIGFSTYFDTIYYDRSNDTSSEHPNVVMTGPVKFKEKRASYAIDMDVTLGNFNMNGEYILNRNRSSLFNLFYRDFFYINLNYGLLKTLRLYIEFDRYRDKSPAPTVQFLIGNGINKFIFGVNFKPNWMTAIKAEINYDYISGLEREKNLRLLLGLSIIF